MKIFKRFFVLALLASLAQVAMAKDSAADFESARVLVEITIQWNEGAAWQHTAAMRAVGLEPSYDTTAAAAPDLSNLAEAAEADRAVFEATGRTPQMMALMDQLKETQRKASIARVADYGRMSRACSK